MISLGENGNLIFLNLSHTSKRRNWMFKRSLAFKVLFLLICLGVVGGNLFGFDFSASEKKISDFTLDNGMKFIVLRNTSAPIVAFCLTVDVGGVTDPQGYAGLAHMLEHMAFKGTSTIGTKDFVAEKVTLNQLDSLFNAIKAEGAKGSAADTLKLAELKASFKALQMRGDSLTEMNEFSTIIDRAGGTQVNAGTGYDRTSYYFSLPSNKLELWFYLESQRFSDPVIRQFYQEREVIREERRGSLESDPNGRLFDKFLKTVFTVHPYGRPLVGEMSDIDNFSPEAIKAYFKKYYVPSNMIAVLVGDVDLKKAKKLAEKYFGSLPKVPKPERLTIVEPEQTAERRVSNSEKAQPVLWIGFHRPSATDPDDPVFDVLADYLGGGRTSLLYKSLIKDKKMALQAIAVSSFPGVKYPPAFVILAVPAKGYTAVQCEQEIMAEVERLRNEPIPEEELAKVKARAKADLIDQLSSRSGMASQLASAQLYYGDWRALFNSLDKLNAVTAQDVQRVANRYLTPEKHSAVYIETVKE